MSSSSTCQLELFGDGFIDCWFDNVLGIPDEYGLYLHHLTAQNVYFSWLQMTRCRHRRPTLTDFEREGPGRF